MSEKRKPELIFYAEYQGNNASTQKRIRLVKVELFPASLWADRTPAFGKGRATGLRWHDTRGDVYRIRVNGKWWKPGDKQTFTLSEFFSIFRRSVKQARAKQRRKGRGNEMQ
jgi:hypothetical protein